MDERSPEGRNVPRFVAAVKLCQTGSDNLTQLQSAEAGQDALTEMRKGFSVYLGLDEHSAVATTSRHRDCFWSAPPEVSATSTSMYKVTYESTRQIQMAHWPV